MISTFGRINSLILSGARAYFAMAQDGRFLPAVAKLKRAGVPGVSLTLQAVSADLLVLPTTLSPATRCGSLYSDLLEYIISALMFYILAVAAVPILRRKRPEAEPSYRTIGYPATPALYVIGAAVDRAAILQNDCVAAVALRRGDRSRRRRHCWTFPCAPACGYSPHGSAHRISSLPDCFRS